jgi:hypothetical protein
MKFSLTINTDSADEVRLLLDALAGNATCATTFLPAPSEMLPDPIVPSIVIPMPSTSTLVFPAADLAPTPAAPVPTSDTDDWGVPYNADIHSSNRAKYASGAMEGRWMKKRGVPDGLFEQAYVGATRGGSTPVATAPVPVPTPVAAAPVPVPQPVAAPAPVPAPVAVATGAPDVSHVKDFNQFVRYITELQTRNDAPVTNARISAVLQTLGYASLPQLATACANASRTGGDNPVPMVAACVAELEVSPA